MTTPVTYRFADGPTTEVEVAGRRAPGRVWELVTDINLPAEYSQEFLGASGSTAPTGLRSARGSRAATRGWAGSGRCRAPSSCASPAPPSAGTSGTRPHPLASWRYTLTPEGDGTRLRYRARLGPGDSPTRQACLAEPDREHEIIVERLDIHRRNMLAVVTGIAELAEKPR